MPMCTASHRLVPSLLFALCMIVSSIQATPDAVVISWDGAADWVVDRLLDEGKLPNLSRLAKQGLRTEFAIPAYPSVTACGHAAIWTGANADVNGITGNSVPLLPRSEHTILENRSGFSSEALLAEPIQITAVMAGKKVVILSSTQSYPPDPHLRKLESAGVSTDNYISFSGFESTVAYGQVYDEAFLRNVSESQSEFSGKEFNIIVGETPLVVHVYDDPRNPVEGFDTVRIVDEAIGQKVTLRPKKAEDSIAHFGGPIRVSKDGQDGFTWFRLYELAPDGSNMLLYQRAVNAFDGSVSPQKLEEYLMATGGFHDLPFSTYSRGDFGKPLFEGGDGTAEERLLELARLDVVMLKRGTNYALEIWQPDLLFHYTPAIDSAGHTWLGLLDPDSPLYDESIAVRLWPYYERMYELQDEWLGAIMDQLSDETIVILVSDHGMAGTSKHLYVNKVLEDAGFLERDYRGEIEINRTKACMPPWGSMQIVVNTTEWKDGIVEQYGKDAVLLQVERALLEARDSETSVSLFTKVFRADDYEGLGLGGPAGGDLYFDTAPGYYATSRLSDVLVRENGRAGSGMHGVFPYHRKMQAICYMRGRGIPADVESRGIHLIDIAPTLAHLLGLPKPAHSHGNIIHAVIATDQ